MAAQGASICACACAAWHLLAAASLASASECAAVADSFAATDVGLALASMCACACATCSLGRRALRLGVTVRGNRTTLRGRQLLAGPRLQLPLRMRGTLSGCLQLAPQLLRGHVRTPPPPHAHAPPPRTPRA